MPISLESPKTGKSQIICGPTPRLCVQSRHTSGLAGLRTICPSVHNCKENVVSLLACASLALVPTAAEAYNVRLEDVENENLQSGDAACKAHHIVVKANICAQNCRETAEPSILTGSFPV